MDETGATARPPSWADPAAGADPAGHAWAYFAAPGDAGRATEYEIAFVGADGAETTATARGVGLLAVASPGLYPAGEAVAIRLRAVADDAAGDWGDPRTVTVPVPPPTLELALTEVARVRRWSEDTDPQLGALRDRLGTLLADYAATKARLATAEGRLGTLTARVVALDKRLAAVETALAQVPGTAFVAPQVTG